MKTLIFKNSVINIDKITEISISRSNVDRELGIISIKTLCNDNIKREYYFNYDNYNIEDFLKYLNENIFKNVLNTVIFKDLIEYYLKNYQLRNA